MVPPPVRPRAARLQLGEPRGRRRSSTDILRFWLDRGVDGFRIDVAHWLNKDQSLPDVGPSADGGAGAARAVRTTRSGTATRCTRSTAGWRTVLDAYDGDRDLRRRGLGRRPRPAGPLRPRPTSCTGVQLRLPARRLDAARAARGSSTSPSRRPAAVGRAHDLGAVQPRRRPGTPPATAGSTPPAAVSTSRPGSARTRRSTRALGLRRARAATLLMLALPGSAYLYQGEELGLPEVVDLPEDVLRDPIWERSGHTRSRGRDGCRVPIPWTRSGPSLGFGTGAPLAAAAADLGRAVRRGAAGRRGLDAGALPRGAGAAPRATPPSATASCAGSTRRPRRWPSSGGRTGPARACPNYPRRLRSFAAERFHAPKTREGALQKADNGSPRLCPPELCEARPLLAPVAGHKREGRIRSRGLDPLQARRAGCSATAAAGSAGVSSASGAGLG